MRAKVDEVLISRSDVSASMQANLRCLHLTSAIYEKFWARVTLEQPQFDYENCLYTEGSRWKGLQSRTTEQWHGLSRQINQDRNLLTLTWRKEGRA